MKITVVGTGYVGLVTGACFAEIGNHVVCLDRDQERIDALQNGHLPIHEPGLLDIVLRNAHSGRLLFTSDVNLAVAHGRVQFIAVGTPAGEDGSADLQHVLAAAQAIAERMQEDRLIVNKSTVPVGTADRVRETMAAVLRARGQPASVCVVSNPEFLKEGSAVQDFVRPDRVVVGADDEQAAQSMRQLYAPFMRNRDRLIVMDVRSAEFTKYAANAMLATRISFMNELALLAEKLGADIEQVRTGMGTDPRIGTHFLYAGTGYGGSCFPKDVKALVHTAREAGQELSILQAVQAVNDRQKQVLVDKIVARFGSDLQGRRFALWGLAFKPDTDDMREAPSLTIIEQLLARGAEIAAYDPVALAQARLVLGERPGLHLVGQADAALEGADALVIVTEWKEFRSPDFAHLAATLRQPVVFDGRNLFEPADMQALGLEYHAIGRGAPLNAP
ncbi:nucleotide sugar dehydrogenase [Acidovorax delafieldii 2AN]|uniref:UDP-glucose 6-dehydrogenase n=1 Tax=Acidovorax delafieldii 2AN TaxID=573060 RepID=C5T2K8_ACIDE|nr:UDP-glucose/GDP-mannose dehydrogenase family protein [Acidovorax delafieldii]EER61320.1 nucleotide sugar dehydrogenase [Acidovorax delafieldii 2AN]